ncbi:hypothetical protein N7474_001153 [Penicillium riverlandense]|uniref:uncharacterized protein n=1 Tax=Penicillium riverlandense TaxID=1903569 RepID=UPI002549B02C|nr:uncharacterized protein N7474_001153 [Penicillium riverlandense]KAJ5832842.1 hypothetical protein N7474_001153 [Penicillium riverlandense]
MPHLFFLSSFSSLYSPVATILKSLSRVSLFRSAACRAHSLSSRTRELIGVTLLLQVADYRLRPERASLLLAGTVFDLPGDLLNRCPSANLLSKFDVL